MWDRDPSVLVLCVWSSRVFYLACAVSFSTTARLAVSGLSTLLYLTCSLLLLASLRFHPSPAYRLTAPPCRHPPLIPRHASSHPPQSLYRKRTHRSSSLQSASFKLDESTPQTPRNLGGSSRVRSHANVVARSGVQKPFRFVTGTLVRHVAPS
jgi:hypothetical protein